ncbi:hypothetical protein K469DRAFT_609955 [Zopfia rhizophila CBS 207.26]|uniref:Mediator complex subunit 15 KIX domain-containing protein n=1 Tax=Zopfia rhizophila CBS 207.26 TaxID=1314779 RepID=A0A6A6DAZ5_9PEZI|nr:hypothetical protein K469DRAFT_609955 [Zopfia rhizophila CBS 207.26]
MNNPNFSNMMPRGTIQQNFINHYRTQQQQQQIPQGWQQSVPPDERAQLALQFFTSYRLLKPETAEIEAVRLSITFESTTFMKCQTKDEYVGQIKGKLIQMQGLRQQRVQGMQNNLNNGMNAGQMGMMGQPGVPTPRPNPTQQFPQGFPNPQLQRPMQASPIPMTQGQSSMGVNGANSMAFQQAQNNQQQNMQRPPQPSQQSDNAMILQLTKKLMSQARPEVMAKLKQDIDSWPPERLQELRNKNIDPLLIRFKQQAEMMIKSGKINMGTGQAGQGAGQNGRPVQQPGQQPQMPNQQMNLNQRQPGHEFDFNALANQQIEALRVQDQGQQVVPASNNANGTQMMGFPGQNPQPGQPQNAMAQRQAAFANAQAQRQAQAQAQAQARAQQQLQQQQQQAAQAQAQAAQAQGANQMLRGQIGGLNLPPGTQQSPAMPMLTRPMVPPGQPGPTTPQQRPQAHVPQMTPQGQPQVDPQVATQLMREAQQRAAVAAQGGQPLTQQLRMSLMPSDLAPELKQQLMQVPDSQFKNILSRYMAQMRQKGANPNAQFPGGQGPISQPNMMLNAAQNLQLGMPGNQMIHGINMGNLGQNPGINLGQQTPNAVAAQQLPIGQQPQNPQQQQQRFLVAQRVLQQNPGIINATDNKPFPSNYLSAPIQQLVPPDVKTWAQIKHWAGEKPDLPQEEKQKLLLLQVMHFQDMMRQAQQAHQNGMAGGQRVPPQSLAGGPAPQTRMVSQPGPPGQIPARTGPQQPSIPPMPPIPQVTPQEIQTFRARLPPNQAHVSDEQLRQWIMNQRMNFRKQQQMALVNQQAQGNQMPQPQPMMPGQGPQTSRPPPAQPQPAQPAPQTKQPNKAQPPPKPAQPTNQNNLNKGVKRPNEDTNESVKTETPAPNATPQAPPMVPSKSQQGMPNLTQAQMQQMASLTPQQQAQMRAQLLKAQDATNKQQQRPHPSFDEVMARAKDPNREAKFRAMLTEEDRKATRGPTIPISPEARAGLQQLVREKLPTLRKVEIALRIFNASYDEGKTEELARSVMRARAQLLRQMNPSDGTLLDQLSLSEEDFKGQLRHIIQFVGKVMSRFQNQQGQNLSGQQNQLQPQAPEAPPAKQHQLNAANLKIVERQQRQQKAPQASTTDRPPFPLGGQSPRGAPTYFVEPQIKAGNLRIPDKKKQKLDHANSQTSTPGQTAPPQVGTGKGGSPQLKRQQQPEKPVEQKPTFKCKESGCDYSLRGFDTQAELDAHFKDNHAKIEDPLQFALDAMADYLDIDASSGQPKSDPTTANRSARPATQPGKAPPQPVKSEQTPSVTQNVTTPAGPQAAATPMARVATQPGIKSSPSTSLLKTPQIGAKVATPSTGVPAKATPSSTTKLATKDTETTVIAEPGKEEENLPFVPMPLFDFSYEDVFSGLDTSGPFTVLDLKDEDTSWVLRSRPNSPIFTPESSSKDSPSTRQSDISENDNLQISIGMKDGDIPDGWLAALNGESLPLDVQLSEDLQALGVTLPPMDNDDLMLFYGDSIMSDIDTFDLKTDSLGAADPMSII